jgi:hypothetical protein
VAPEDEDRIRLPEARQVEEVRVLDGRGVPSLRPGPRGGGGEHQGVVPQEIEDPVAATGEQLHGEIQEEIGFLAG